MTTAIKQTFRERLADTSKLAYSPEFIKFIKQVAERNNKPEDEIYTYWLRYCSDCSDYDQSPVESEFLDWNGLLA